MIHISATTERLLVAAELMELKKPYHDGSLREVSLANLSNFKNTGTVHYLIIEERGGGVLNKITFLLFCQFFYFNLKRRARCLRKLALSEYTDSGNLKNSYSA